MTTNDHEEETVGAANPYSLRDREIQRLAELASKAFEKCQHAKSNKAEQTWHQRYTNHVLALNVLLKDRQLHDYEQRMKIIEQHTLKKLLENSQQEKQR